MQLDFNELGVLVNTSDENIRQGSVGNIVRATFTGISNLTHIAKLNYSRPDGTHLDNIVMDIDSTSANSFKLVLNDVWYSAIYGEASLSIYLYDGNGNIVANGQVDFDIEETDYYEQQGTITPEQYNYLLTQIASYQDAIKDYIDDGNVVELTTPPLISNITDEQYEILTHENSLIKHNNEYYYKSADENSALVFCKIKIKTVSGSNITIEQEHIRVQKSEGHLIIFGSTIISVIYNKDQIDSIISAITDGTTIVGKAEKDSLGNIIHSTYESKSDATSKLNESKSYTDIKVNDAGHSLVLVSKPNYVYDIQLKDKANNVISTISIDLPTESIVVSGRYDSTSKSIVLTLENGNTINIPVGDLVEGLIDEQGLEEALAPYVKSGKVSSVLTTGDLITNFGLEKTFVLDVLGDLLLCYIEETENSGYYTMSVVGKNSSYKTQSFTNAELVINVLGTGTLEVDYLPVIELTNAMQTLTSSQLQVANQDNSIIKYSGRLYHKSNDSGTTLEFVSVDYDIVDEGANNKITKYEITVNKSSGTTNMITMYLNVYSVGEMDALLNEKANTSGDYPLLKVGKSLVAEQIENINDESGSTQTNPFLFQGTGTNDNTTETPTSPVAKHLELRGNSIVWNQFVGTFNSETTANVTITASNNGRKIELSGNANSYFILTKYFTKIIPVGHKLLVKGVATNNSAISNSNIGFRIRNSSDVDIEKTLNDTNNFNYIYTTTIQTDRFQLFGPNSGDYIGLSFENIQVFDLTDIYGAGKEPTTVLAFNRDYPLPYYEYNDGELKSCSSSQLVTIGCNQFDGGLEGGSINTETGENQSGTNNFRTKNYIEVIPGHTYNCEYNYEELGGTQFICEYDGNKNYLGYSFINNSGVNVIELNANTRYIRINYYKSGSGWSSNIPSLETAKIMVRLYWNETHEYVPYIKHEYDLPSVELRSDREVFDKITPNGILIRNVVEVDLGSVEWYYDNILSCWQSNLFSSFVADNSVAFNVLCEKYTSIRFNAIASSEVNSIAFRDNGYIYVNNGSNSVQPSGKAIYKLATPTTEQVSLFAENIEVDDFGTMEFVPSDSTEEVIVPQGNKFFYPADYVLFIDDMYNRSKDGGETSSAKNFVTQSQIKDFIKEKIDFSSSLIVDNSANLTEIRKELYLVKSGRSIKLFCYYSAKNESGSQINGIRISNTNIVVSDNFIKTNIKDMNGNELSSATAGIIGVATQNIYYDGNMVIKPIRLQHSTTNKLTLYDGSSLNLPNNGNLIIEIEKEWFVE